MENTPNNNVTNKCLLCRELESLLIGDKLKHLLQGEVPDGDLAPIFTFFLDELSEVVPGNLFKELESAGFRFLQVQGSWDHPIDYDTQQPSVLAFNFWNDKVESDELYAHRLIEKYLVLRRLIS